MVEADFQGRRIEHSWYEVGKGDNGKEIIGVGQVERRVKRNN